MSDVFSILQRSDGLGFGSIDPSTQWGIFKDGVSVIVADSVRSFGYRQEWPISTYPVEQGAFESYDKIELPFEPRVRFVTGGDLIARQAFLASIQAIAGDLNLYDVVTPEKTFLSTNVTHVEYYRDNGNAGMITVDVRLLEIRVSASPQYNTATPLANTKSPSAASPVSGGTVQTDVPSTAPNIGSAPILPSNFAGSVT